MIRKEILELKMLGPVPDEDSNEENIARYQEMLERIKPPVTDEEAKVLVTLFGPDSGYGLPWALVHLIESAPSWPIEDCLRDRSNPWIQTLREAAGLSG